MEIWNIGHSTRTEDDFLSLLKKSKIEIVADVRRFPSSKKFPHFGKAYLEHALLATRLNQEEQSWISE